MTAKELTKARRINSSGADKGVAHRTDFETCPCCPDDEYPYEGHRMRSAEWMKRAVTLVMEPAVYKAEAVAIISECPRCFGLSWVHQRYTSIYWDVETFPTDWRNATRKKAQQLTLEAHEQWNGSLCKTCRQRDGEPTLGAAPVWRSCIAGIGPVLAKSEACPKYKKEGEYPRMTCNKPA